MEDSERLELQRLTEILEKTAARYRMEICSQKSKIIIDNTKRRWANNMKMNDQTLEELNPFQYLGSKDHRWYISKGKWDKTDAVEFSHDKAGRVFEKQKQQ